MDIMEVHRLRLVQLLDQCAGVDADLQRIRLDVLQEMAEIISIQSVAARGVST